MNVVLAQTPITLPRSPAQNDAASDTSLATAESVVRKLYRLVSVSPGGARTDWEAVRALFYKDAVIVLRTSPRATTVFSVQGFIAHFVAFDERARVQERGFSEKIIRLKAMVFQDIAHLLVLYEAHTPGSSRPLQQGVE